MQRYRALRNIAMVLKVLAWIVAVLGVVGSIVGAVGAEAAADAVVVLIVGLLATAIWGMLLLGASEAIHVLIDVEQNTRDTAESVRQSAKE